MISIKMQPSDIKRLKAILADRNAPQKHVWLAEIVLLTAQGIGTSEIVRQTGNSKTCVWRWQERFKEEGVDGLLRADLYSNRNDRERFASKFAILIFRLSVMNSRLPGPH